MTKKIILIQDKIFRKICNLFDESLHKEQGKGC